MLLVLSMVAGGGCQCLVASCKLLVGSGRRWQWWRSKRAACIARRHLRWSHTDTQAPTQSRGRAHKCKLLALIHMQNIIRRKVVSPMSMLPTLWKTKFSIGNYIVFVVLRWHCKNDLQSPVFNQNFLQCIDSAVAIVVLLFCGSKEWARGGWEREREREWRDLTAT